MGGKSKRTDRKKGVPFKMMFRHHMDPDYYDPKANDKIFVPDVEGKLTEQQQQIVETFPERDRGLYKPGENVEADPLEAAVKKMKIRKEQRIKDKEEEAKHGKKKVRFGDEEEDSDDSA